MIPEQLAVLKRLEVPAGPKIEKEFWFTNNSQVKGESLWPKIPASAFFSTPAFPAPERFLALRKANIDTKDKLDHLDQKLWRAHTTSTKVASNVIFRVRDSIHAEFVTRAWCKMTEMLSAYELLPLHSEGITSFHICEAPGAFIASTNHFIQSQISTRTRWNWRGFTLNPYYEENDLEAMVDQDNLIMETIEKWRFGADNSGDVRSKHNIAGLRKEAQQQMNGAHLVTADGSISCFNFPDKQEQVTGWLHFCESVCAISLLRAGGNFVCKMFTLFEAPSICLLRLLASCFERVGVCKPALSSEGNSEVYIVCLR